MVTGRCRCSGTQDDAWPRCRFRLRGSDGRRAANACYAAVPAGRWPVPSAADSPASSQSLPLTAPLPDAATRPCCIDSFGDSAAACSCAQRRLGLVELRPPIPRRLQRRFRLPLPSRCRAGCGLSGARRVDRAASVWLQQLERIRRQVRRQTEVPTSMASCRGWRPLECDAADAVITEVPEPPALGRLRPQRRTAADQRASRRLDTAPHLRAALRHNAAADAARWLQGIGETRSSHRCANCELLGAPPRSRRHLGAGERPQPGGAGVMGAGSGPARRVRACAAPAALALR